jgi:hypothetical protein
MANAAIHTLVVARDQPSALFLSCSRIPGHARRCLAGTGIMLGAPTDGWFQLQVYETGSRRDDDAIAAVPRKAAD